MLPIPYTPELGERVCEGLLECKPMKDIANGLGISTTTIQKWALNNPLFADAMAVARAESAHVLVDQAAEVARDCAIDHRRAKNLIHVLLFAAERRNRKAYGQSVDLQITERVDLGGTLLEARKRTVLQPMCDLAQLPATQDADYVMLEPPRTTDTQSAEGVKAPYNPFD